MDAIRNPISAEPNKSDFFTKHYNAFLVVILLGAAVLYALRQPVHRTGIYNDDALYVIVANDFWKTADSHPLQGIKPDFPLPGLPMILAPFAKVFGPNWTSLEWVSTLFTLLTIFILGKWSRNWMTDGESLFVLSLFAFNPFVAKFSGIIMPAPFFTMAIVLSFFLLGKALREQGKSHSLALGLVLGWAAVIRPEGVLLLASIVGALTVARRIRPFAKTLAVPLVVWLVFVVCWFVTRQTSRTEYGRDIAALTGYWFGNMISAGLYSVQMLHVFLTTTLAGLQLKPGPGATFLSLTVVMVFLSLIATGIVQLYKRSQIHRAELLAVGSFCAFYFLTHLFWHVAVPRYFVPLLPFALILMVIGFNGVVSLWKMPSPWILIACLIPAVSYGYGNFAAVSRHFSNPDLSNSPPWQSFDWVKKNTAPTSRIISNIDSSVELYTGRQCKGSVKGKDIGTFIYLCQRLNIEYILLRTAEAQTPGVGSTNDPNAVWSRYERWFELYPQFFEPVFFKPIEKVRIYKIASRPKFDAAFQKYIAATKAYIAGDYGQSFKDVLECLKLEPDMGRAVNLMGALYMLRKDAMKAQEFFLKAIKLRPDSPAPILNLATLYQLTGNKDRSEDLIKKGLEVSVSIGEEKKFVTNLQKLQALWDQNSAAVYIDTPDVTPI